MEQSDIFQLPSCGLKICEHLAKRACPVLQSMSSYHVCLALIADAESKPASMMWASVQTSKQGQHGVQAATGLRPSSSSVWPDHGSPAAIRGGRRLDRAAQPMCPAGGLHVCQRLHAIGAFPPLFTVHGPLRPTACKGDCEGQNFP